jgi:molecular chaperone DnaK (HSP70)
MDIAKVVISMPTRFNMEQRQTIINAALIADLKVMHIINEPTAVAISYFLANPKEKKEFCVFDFGSSKLDIAIVKTDSKSIKLVDCETDLQLGGRDFDECLFKHVREAINRKHPGIKLTPKDFMHIRQECLKAKINLGTTSETIIDIDLNQDEIQIPIKSAYFESLCIEPLNRVENLIKALKDRNPNVDTVVLIGGSTRIPVVQKILSRYFKIVNKSLNADESVAIGAAAYPILLSKTLEKIDVVDIPPWDKEVSTFATKIKFFIEDGIVCEKVYSKATNVEFDLNNEKKMMEELFNKKEAKASKYAQKQILVAPEQPHQVFIDIEVLINRSQALSPYKNDIEKIFETAGIHKTKFDNFKAYGNEKAVELEKRVRRVEAYMFALEVFSSMNGMVK